MQVSRPRFAPALAAAAALVLAAVACGGAAASTTHGVAGARKAIKRGALVKLRKTPLGKVLVDSRGRTLYLYTPDTGKKSTCYGGCASAWPPLLSTGKPRAGEGVKAQLLGLTMRTDGTHQVTYKGHPLYFYAADSKAGDVNGEDVGGVWYAVSARGAKVARRQSSTTTTTTPTPSPGYGYGYGGGG